MSEFGPQCGCTKCKRIDCICVEVLPPPNEIYQPTPAAPECCCGADCEASTSGKCTRCGLPYAQPAQPAPSAPREVYIGWPDGETPEVVETLSSGAVAYVEKARLDAAEKNAKFVESQWKMTSDILERTREKLGTAQAEVERAQQAMFGMMDAKEKMVVAATALKAECDALKAKCEQLEERLSAYQEKRLHAKRGGE